MNPPSHGIDVSAFGGSMFNFTPSATILKANQRLGTLSCDAFEGPHEEEARREVVYWQDIPQDQAFVSPFHDAQHPKFLTFEPDPGGFNNIRMAMETALTMAIAMGRVLVLPPSQKMYLLQKKGGDSKSKPAFGFHDFFPMQEMARRIKGLVIISTQDFLEAQGVTGKLRSFETGKVLFPPDNRTSWDGDNVGIENKLNPYLRKVGFSPPAWSSVQCMAAFPETPGDDETMTDLFEKLSNPENGGGWPSYDEFVGHPTSVRATAEERWKENNAARPNLCLYNRDLQAKDVLHFATGRNMTSGRLLVHSYAFLFFEDWKQDLWMKRFVRDQVRYNDQIQCAAARIVQAIRRYVVSKQQNKKNEVAPTSTNAPFDAFHVRRGDFQYKRTRVEADIMYDMCKDEIPEGEVVYMATDEVRNKSFFNPLAQHYDLLFLDNFTHLIRDMNPNYYGMIDQLVASRSRTFFGCWFSTFTGYINRLRGYDSDLHKLPGFAHGILNSYYYALPDKKYRMREYWPLSGAFYAREFPTAWRNIDHGIQELYDEQHKQEQQQS